MDEYIFRDLSGARMNVPDSVDVTEWGRALSYIAHKPGVEVEVSSNNLIQTRIPGDSNLFGYSVTRTPYKGYALYDITCTSRRKNIDADYLIRRLSFYIQTGREYIRSY